MILFLNATLMHFSASWLSLMHLTNTVSNLFICNLASQMFKILKSKDYILNSITTHSVLSLEDSIKIFFHIHRDRDVCFY